MRDMSDKSLDDIEKQYQYIPNPVVGEYALQDDVPGEEHIVPRRGALVDKETSVVEEVAETVGKGKEHHSGIRSFGTVGFMRLAADLNSNRSEESELNVSMENPSNISRENLAGVSIDNLTDVSVENPEDVAKQTENETTPADPSKRVAEEEHDERAVGDMAKPKRRRVFGSPKVKQWTSKTTKSFRVKRLKSTKVPTTGNAAKKNFKSNFLTVKFKLSEMQIKAGKVPDFALFVKNDVHDHKAPNSANHAGKYVSYVKGNIANTFFTKGICYNPDDLFICGNEVDLQEDSCPMFKKKSSATTRNDRTKNVTKIRQKTQTIIIPESSDASDTSEEEGEDESDAQKSSSGGSDVESELDLFDMARVATVVRCPGTPSNRESSCSSESSGGVKVYGRGAEKPPNKEKKKRKAALKKRGKESAKRTATDLLDSFELVVEKGAGPSNRTGVGKGQGKGGKETGKGKVGKGKASGKGGRGKGGRKN